MPHNPFLPSELSPNAAMRLIGLPYAGGGVAMYYRWRSLLPSRIEVVPIHLPGRDERIAEPPQTELRTLVGEIADALAPVIDRPFAILGHSMGAWIAFELACELRRRGAPLPRLLFVAASCAPHRPRAAPPMHQLPDAEFVAELTRRFDGIPPAVRANDELVRLLLPALRADIRLVETYEYRDEPPLAADILAIGGADDRAVSATELADWRRHTAGRFSSRMVPGGHFFLFQDDDTAQQRPAAVRMIMGQLERYLAD